MTDSFVTQCPHCQTSFRVSHAQLSVARGMVRCGSCLQVFNAAKQLLEQRAGSSPQAPEPAEPSAPPVQPVQPVQPPPAVAEKTPAILATQSLAVAPPAPLPVRREDSTVDLDSLDLDDLDVELARLEQREIQLPESFGRVSKARDHDEVESFSARRDEPDVAQESWAHGMSHDDVDRLPELRAEVVEEREEHTDHTIDEGPLDELINQHD